VRDKELRDALERARAWAEHCREGLSRLGRAKKLWRRRALDALEASGAYYALAQRLEKTCQRQKAVIANLLRRLAESGRAKREAAPKEALEKENLKPSKVLKDANVLQGWEGKKKGA
jgi:hypothetical protein